MQRHAKTRIGVAALTLAYSLLAFPLTAHASPGVGHSGGWGTGGFIKFGSEGGCDETGEGWTKGGYAMEDDHGYYTLDSWPTTGTANGRNIGELVLCGEMSRQPSDDPVLGAVGAGCQSGGELLGFQVPTGRNGFGRMTYIDGPTVDDIQFSDVRMVFTPAESMVFRGEYTSSPDMANASTGTAIIHVQAMPSSIDCLLFGGAVSGVGSSDGDVVWMVSFALIPDVE